MIQYKSKQNSKQIRIFKKIIDLVKRIIKPVC
nr:MAG TPA: hypothetical protein [Caudoviricetes sp.]